MLQPREREKKRLRAVREATHFVRVREATGIVRSHHPESTSLPESEFDATIDLFCRAAPRNAFDCGVEVLTKVVDAMSSLVEENRVDLDAIEARGEELDRLNEENKRQLAELVAG